MTNCTRCDLSHTQGEVRGNLSRGEKGPSRRLIAKVILCSLALFSSSAAAQFQANPCSRHLSQNGRCFTYNVLQIGERYEYKEACPPNGTAAEAFGWQFSTYSAEQPPPFEGQECYNVLARPYEEQSTGPGPRWKTKCEVIRMCSSGLNGPLNTKRDLVDPVEKPEESFLHYFNTIKIGAVAIGVLMGAIAMHFIYE